MIKTSQSAPTRFNDVLPRRGFSLLELMIVIGVMLALMSVSVLVIGNVLQSARKKATQATITKIYQAISMRQDALSRTLDPDNGSNLQSHLDRADMLVTRAYRYNPSVAPVDLLNPLVKYDRIARAKIPVAVAIAYRNAFPQRFTDVCGYDRGPGNSPSAMSAPYDDDGDMIDDFYPNGFPDIDEFLAGNDQTETTSITDILVAFQRRGLLNPTAHTEVTESSELLYLALMEAVMPGNAPVEIPDFAATEVQDTDGDGLMEFIDAWGQPLRFYRCPTRLIRVGVNSDGTSAAAPLNAGIQAVPDPRYAIVVLPNLPSQIRDPMSSSDGSALQRDPYDPGSLLEDYICPSSNLDLSRRYEAWFYTPRTYHSMLVVSAGPDKELGLYEPGASVFPPGPADYQGHLAQPTQYGPLEESPMSDNVGGFR